MIIDIELECMRLLILKVDGKHDFELKKMILIMIFLEKNYLNLVEIQLYFECLKLLDY